MTLTDDLDKATKWDVTLGINRDWARTITFVDEDNNPYSVSANDVEAVINRSFPVAITVVQGDAENQIVLSVTADTLGTEHSTDRWYVDVSGKRWFAGKFTTTSATASSPGVDEYIVQVGDSVTLVATVQVPTTVNLVGDTSPPGLVSYVHAQSTPSTVWTVQHGLGYRPGGITVLDADDDLILGWVANNASAYVLVLTFPQAESGTAYIS